MHDFVYVTRKEAAPLKAAIIELIHLVQNDVRNVFTFRYDFVGSSSNNMITYDKKGNVGFDFDVNIEPNDLEELYSAKQVRDIIRNAFNNHLWKYEYSFAEDSTSVITIKSINHFRKTIKHSCDFAIVYNCDNGHQQYIRYNKDQRTYTWEDLSQKYDKISEKITWLKNQGLWNNFLDYYLCKKNTNKNPNKHSRSIFAESVYEICAKNGFNTFQHKR